MNDEPTQFEALWLENKRLRSIEAAARAYVVAKDSAGAFPGKSGDVRTYYNRLKESLKNRP